MKTSALPHARFDRILLVKPSAVGDVIHTLPVLVKLRNRYPEARIDWLLTPSIAELIGHHPALSNVIPFERNSLARLGRSWSAVGDLVHLLRAIRRPRYDLVIDLHGQFRSALLVLATGAPVRIGFDGPGKDPRRGSERNLPGEAYRHGWTGAREGSWLAYTHRIPIPTLDVHAIDRYLWISDLLGLDSSPPDLRIPIPVPAEERVEELLQSHGLLDRPLAVLVPGTRWETKHWHVEGFAAVARHLLRTGRAVVLAGSASERERCDIVASMCPGACSLAGETKLSELAALMRRAAVCVTNDSGSMHLAVALERPVVSIFGPTDPVWIGPYRRPESVVRADLPCAPCYLRQVKACRHDHACMRQVSAEAVIARVEKVLAGVGTNAA